MEEVDNDAFEVDTDSDQDATRKTRSKKVRENEGPGDEEESIPRISRIQAIVDLLANVERCRTLFGDQAHNSNQMAKILTTQSDIARDSRSETLINTLRIAFVNAVKRGIPGHWNVIEADGKTLYQLRKE